MPCVNSCSLTFGFFIRTLTLKLRLAQRWCVASNDDELCLSGSQSLECGLVAESDLARLVGVRFALGVVVVLLAMSIP